MATSAIVYKIPQPRGYSDRRYFIEDRSESSPEYFNVQDFPLVLGGGRHIIRLKGNSLNMRLNSTIDVEIIDAEGQRIFCEVLNYVDRFNNYYVALDVYDITAQGVATAYFVGEAIVDLQGNPVPEAQRDTYNVRWVKQFSILPYERNNAELIFDNPPEVSVAQVVTPARQSIFTTQSAYNFTYVTSSVDLFTIKNSNFVGYDRDFASSTDILDTRERQIAIDPLLRPSTVNRVPTYVRQIDADVQNGNVINYTRRFGTTVVASSSFWSKQLLGGFFEFFSSQSTPQVLLPALPSGITFSGSTSSQLQTYKANVVEVINSYTAVLSEPITLDTIDSRGVREKPSTFTVKEARQFTASITYIPHAFSFVTSSTVSASYVQLTFNNLQPISGEVYRIRTSTKLQQVTGDYKLLNDQIITPVEYLSDAAFPNGLNYTRHVSDYRLVGHFVTQSILDEYWHFIQEDGAGFDYVSGSVNGSVLMDSANLTTNFTQSKCFTTQFYQNYVTNQTYTLSFYLVLDPYTELEVYMNSDPLNSYILSNLSYPKAFERTLNNERSRYSADRNRFGKYLGKIVNDRPTRKYYGQVLYDFETDADGFGRPCFRAKRIDYMNSTGSAFISEASIKPYYMNGFTPNIVQYAVPLPTDLLNAVQLSQSIDFKIDYFDYTGKQSEYSTYLDDIVLNLKVEIPSNTCQDDRVYFTYDSSYLPVSQQRPR